MAIDRGNETTTQLLTLLNVSATKAGKRKWILDDTRPSEKLNKRRNVQFGEVQVNELSDSPAEPSAENADEDATMGELEEVRETEEEDEISHGASGFSFRRVRYSHRTRQLE